MSAAQYSGRLVDNADCRESSCIRIFRTASSSSKTPPAAAAPNAPCANIRGKIPDDQVWQLVAYVRWRTRLVPTDVAPGRKDSMSAKEPEAMTEPQPPKKQ